MVSKAEGTREMIILPRRKFLTGLMGLVAAPAVIRVAPLMAIKSIAVEEETFLSPFLDVNPLIEIASPSPGWIAFNGATISRSSYPALWSALFAAPENTG